MSRWWTNNRIRLLLPGIGASPGHDGSTVGERHGFGSVLIQTDAALIDISDAACYTPSSNTAWAGCRVRIASSCLVYYSRVARMRRLRKDAVALHKSIDQRSVGSSKLEIRRYKLVLSAINRRSHCCQMGHDSWLGGYNPAFPRSDMVDCQ